jgi:CRISPR/Cas system Type II protein with McrA/HNH and RuvC-like nuclease domain
MSLLTIIETVQVSDTFLIKFKCKYCNEINFNDWKNYECAMCKTKNGTGFEFNGSKLKFRCLVGTRRKNIRFSKKKINLLREIQNNSCAYCDLYLENYHIDHVVPISFGGSNNLDNLVLSCPPCNLKASSNVFPGFAEKRDFIRESRKIDKQKIN